MTWRCHFRLAIEAGADPIMSIKDRCLTNVWRYCDETHKKELEVEGKSDPLKGFASMSISIQVLPSSAQAPVEIRHRPAQAPVCCSCDRGRISFVHHCLLGDFTHLTAPIFPLNHD